ncbi:hypothetical protein ACJX0J_023950, partial [Zea mays]
CMGRRHEKHVKKLWRREVGARPPSLSTAPAASARRDVVSEACGAGYAFAQVQEHLQSQARQQDWLSLVAFQSFAICSIMDHIQRMVTDKMMKTETHFFAKIGVSHEFLISIFCDIRFIDIAQVKDIYNPINIQEYLDFLGRLLH